MSDDWQPMETAPQDGTVILARIPGEGVFLIRWGDPDWFCKSWVTADDAEPPRAGAMACAGGAIPMASRPRSRMGGERHENRGRVHD